MPVKKEGIAWDYLSDLEKAQLLHFRPEMMPEQKTPQAGDSVKVKGGG